jgi:hypothetical protein
MSHNHKNHEKVELDVMAIRYNTLPRADKSRLLNELCDLYSYNRKYLLQVFNYLAHKKYVKKGRKAKYTSKDLLQALGNVWLASNQMCSKKLKAALPMWLPFYSERYGALRKDVRTQLLHLSAATIDRLLKPIRAKHSKHGLSGTRPGYLLKTQIPIKTDHWDVNKPGFMEADTVAHCGTSLAGNFVWSLTLTDIHTSWTENRATWNKGAEGVIEQIKDIEKSLPFELLGFDCDNGSEFLNYHLLRYFTENRPKPVQFTRSRPYKKNDNAHVEQKNWTHVRHLFGYDRFENQAVVGLMNDLYRNEWSLYQNHFIPTMKLIKKVRINSKYKKTYSLPETPYQRVIQSKDVKDEVKLALIKLHNTLNPFALKQKIEEKLRLINKYVTINGKPRAKI